MLSSLALLLCTGFVIFLLRLEQRASRGISLTVWIPTVWMMIIASRPLVEWFYYVGPGGVKLNNDAGSAIDRWVLIGLAVAAIVVLIYRRVHWWDCLRRQKALLVILAYMLLSTFWSEITPIALKRWTRELIVPLMAMVIISEVNPRQALESIFRRTAYVLLPFSIVLIKYYPAIGRAYGKFSGVEMWTGVTGQKNQLGRLCAVSILFLMFALHRYWQDRAPLRRDRSQARADACIVFLGLYLLIGSHSSTALVTLILGAVILIGLRMFRRMKIPFLQSGLLALVILLLALGVATPFLGGSDVARFTDSLGRDETLTGRTEVWADVMPARAQRPLLGYGLGSFWTDARRKLYDIPTAHNGYLDILLELGVVGLALYAVWLLSCTRILHRALAQDYGWASLGLCFLLMGLLYNVTESSLNTLTEHMTAVVVFTSFMLSNVPFANRAKTRVAAASKLQTYGSKLQPSWPVATKTKTWHEV